MGSIEAIIDTHIRVLESDLPRKFAHELRIELEFKNRERDRAARENVWGWRDMPKYIKLWRQEYGDLVLPRGFRWQFEQELRETYGIEVEWDDCRASCDEFSHGLHVSEFPMRPHQPAAVEKILNEQDGIYQAPAGSGKTVTVLDVIRRAGQRRNIVIVNRMEIAMQWRDRAEQFLGVDVGLIGDGMWDEQPLTIATQQTLHSRKEDLDFERWWGQWGLVCLDECHHQTAETYVEVMQRFPSLYRFGVSATPSKTGDFERAEAVLGDIIHVTTKKDLENDGTIIMPQVRVVETGFTFDFHSTFTSKRCGIAGCNRDGKRRHQHRNNYQGLLKALKEDQTRNELIIQCVVQEQNRRQIVVAPHKTYLDRLITLAKARLDVPIYQLTGSENTAKRQEVIELIKQGPCVTFSTIAYEALDIPELDCLHMPWPGKNVGTVEQMIGRIERAIPGKSKPVAYDYADFNNELLTKHFDNRLWEFYKEYEYELVYMGALCV